MRYLTNQCEHCLSAPAFAGHCKLKGLECKPQMRKMPRSKSSKAKLKRESEVNNGLVLLNNGQNQSAAGQQSEAAEVPEVVSKESVSRIPQLIGKTFNYLGDSISSGMSYLQRMGISMVEGASGPLVCAPQHALQHAVIQ